MSRLPRAPILARQRPSSWEADLRLAMYVLLFAAVAAMLVTTGIALGVGSVPHQVAIHWQSAIWAVLFVLMAHTLVLFYFLATGKQLRTLMETSGREVDRHYLADLRRFKSKVFPWVMWALFSTIATFVIGGGVRVGMVPRPVHAALGALALFCNVVGAGVEIASIERNTRLIQAIEREYLGRTAGTGAPVA